MIVLPTWYCSCFLLTADFYIFFKSTFSKDFSGISSESQAVWIQIRPGVSWMFIPSLFYDNLHEFSKKRYCTLYRITKVSQKVILKDERRLRLDFETTIQSSTTPDPGYYKVK